MGDLEDELRNLKFDHLSEIELATYCDLTLDLVGRARVEAHVKQCFICERQLESFQEEHAALSQRMTTDEDVAFIDRLLETSEPAPESLFNRRPEITDSIRERLSEYLRQMVSNWHVSFSGGAMRGEINEKMVWSWESVDGKLRAHATLQKNADLIIHFSSSDLELKAAHLNIRLGANSYDVTMEQTSQSELTAQVVVPWHHRLGHIADMHIVCS